MAGAEKIAVTNAHAQGRGSLPSAIRRANAHGGRDTVYFPTTVREAIPLRSKLTITGSTVLQGRLHDLDKAQSSPLRLVGDDELPHRLHGTVLRVIAGDQERVVLRNLNLRRVFLRPTAHGAGSTVDIRDSYVEGGHSARKVGIWAGDPRLHGGDSPKHSASKGVVRVIDSVVTGFRRDPIWVTRAHLRIDRTTISNNTSVYGGVYALKEGHFVMTNSTVTGNYAGNDPNGVVAATNDSSGTVTNSTITTNRSDAPTVSGGVDLRQVTISSNTTESRTGAIRLTGRGGPTMANSIVSGNTSDGVPSDCATRRVADGRAMRSLGGNLVQAPGSCSLSPRDLTGADPMLLPLADYGGPTETQPLAADSPAIGLAIPRLATKLDQRGFHRGGDPDSGAFERRGG
jgi:hypothetical protein